MQHGTLVVPAPTTPVADDLSVRGIYEFEHKVEGCPAYFALTRKRQVTGRGLRVLWPGDSKANIFAELERELREFDPVRPTYLQLHVEPPTELPKRLTLADALDLDGPDFARWLYQ